MADAPRRCPICNARRSLHGGHGGHINRHGWYDYECGRRWHKDRGWSSSERYCLERRFKRALQEIRGVKTLVEASKIANKAVLWKRIDVRWA